MTSPHIADPTEFRELSQQYARQGTVTHFETNLQFGPGRAAGPIGAGRIRLAHAVVEVPDSTSAVSFRRRRHPKCFVLLLDRVHAAVEFSALLVHASNPIKCHQSRHEWKPQHLISNHAIVSHEPPHNRPHRESGRF